MPRPITRRRLLVVAAGTAGAMFGLAACGNSPTTAGASSSSGTATGTGTSSSGGSSASAATASTSAGTATGATSATSSGGVSTSGTVATSASTGGSKLAVVNGQLTHGGISPTPRNQTVIIDQSLFTVFDSFNPYIPNGQEYEAGVEQVCREYLWYNDLATGQLVPWLGKSWAYNSDYTECTLKLNPKPTWSDGKPFTSADVAFTFTMLQKNTALLAKGVQEYLESVTTPDAQTVVMKLKKPNPRWHSQFITDIIGSFIVEPQHVWAGKDPTTFKNNPPIYTGPYVLDQVLSADYMYIWKKNPNYWNKAAFDPKPQYIVVRSAPTPDSDVEEFQRGLTDVGSFDYLHAVHLNQSYKSMVIEDGFLDPCPTAVMVNCDPSKGALADPRFRWALSYLLDRAKIGKIFYQPAFQPAKYPWPAWKSNDKWNVPSVQQQYDMTYDPKKAASLLDAMGATMGANGIRVLNGKPLSFALTTTSQVGQSDYQAAQYFAQEAKKAGIDLSLKYQQGATFYHQNQVGNYDIAWAWLCGEVDDPVQLYDKFLKINAAPIGQLAPAGWDAPRLQDPTLSDLAQKLDNVTPDLSNAGTKHLYDQALAEYMKQLPFIVVNQKVIPAVFNTKYWTGWPTNQNLYQVPSNWWGQFMFVIGKLQPAGG